MSKINMIIKYKMGYQLQWSTLALAIYITTMFLTFYPLINFSLVSAREGSFVYRLWFIVIFQFAISMRFKEDFDFLLTLSNTRREIYLSLLGVAIYFSILFSGLIIIERLIVDHLNKVFGYQNINDPFHFISPYATDNLLMQYFFFLMISACFSLFGLLMGSLFYRFGKNFTLFFWLSFSAIPAIVLPLILWIFYQQGRLSILISAAGEYLHYFDLAPVSWFFFFLTLIFGLGAYLNIRGLPQR